LAKPKLEISAQGHRVQLKVMAEDRLRRGTGVQPVDKEASRLLVSDPMGGTPMGSQALTSLLIAPLLAVKTTQAA